MITLVVAAVPIGLYAFDDDDDDKGSDKRFSFAAIGDQPYDPTFSDGAGLHQSYPAPAYERLIADINKAEVSFTVHAGDIKAGNTLCEDNVYTQNKVYFNTFKKPLIYTPGDNEWTDCHRNNNGGIDPIGRLALIRSTFFSTNKSLGKDTLNLTRQAGYPENARWVYGPIVFVTINQPGSNNNHQRNVTASNAAIYGTPAAITDNEAEYTARRDANIVWLNAAFTVAAASSKIKGVVIIAQANPFERFLEGGQGYTDSGYKEFITTVRGYAQTSGKRILYIGGDTHYFRVDKPLTATYPSPTVLTPGGARIVSFTRHEVFAQADVHWTRISVDSKDADLFSFTPMVVPGN